MSIRSIKQVKNLAGKRVLVRVDFNVPVKSGRVADDFKIQKTLPSLRYLIERGARVAIISHLGRPKGVEKSLSLRPIARRLEILLKTPVPLLKSTVLPGALRTLEGTLARLPPGGLCMVENIRFFAPEREKDPQFAKALAGTADLFVIDCFGVTHHPAPSITGLAKHLPSYAGLLLLDEVAGLGAVLQRPKRPLVIMLGGAKIETKIPVLRHLLSRADYILVGGGVVNTYLWAKGFSVGRSLIEPELKKEVLRYCANKKIVLPIDVVVGNASGRGAVVMPVDSKLKIQSSKLAIYDIGPMTVRLFARYIKQARTLLWNGALGMFEVHPYQFGTYALADLFAARSRGRAFGVAGGGETVEILKKRGILEAVDLVSTGGGAMLEFLSGGKLPGIEIVRR